MSWRTEKYNPVLLPEGWKEHNTFWGDNHYEGSELEGGILAALDKKSPYLVLTDCHQEEGRVVNWIVGLYFRESWSEEERKEWLRFPVQIPYSERNLPEICDRMCQIQRGFFEMVALDVREGAFYLRMPR